VDSAWEQEKLKARKMLVNRAESHPSAARFVGNLMTADKKMAPNLFYSEPFSNFETNFQIRAILPLTLLFIGSPLLIARDSLTGKGTMKQAQSHSVRLYGKGIDYFA